jgi:predicted permease
VLRLLAINPGFKTEHLLTTNVVFPFAQFNTEASLVSLFQRLGDSTLEIPGVESIGFVSRLPLDFGNSLGFQILGQPVPEPGRGPGASYRQTSVDYFKTMGIPVVAGRAFGPGDDQRAPQVAVVNRALTAAYFKGMEPVGQRITIGNDTVTVIGVVGDVPIGSIEDKIPPTLYLAFAQNPQASMAMAIRTSASADQVTRSLRAVLSSVERSGAITAVTPMDDLITDSPSVFMRRFPLYLVGAFAATALILAIVGIYGVVSYSVAQRTREMGIRMALGAQPASLVRLVMSHGGWMAGIGIVAGVGGAVALGRFADKLLYGVRPSDPVTYVYVAVVLAAVAIGATILPARRATRVDPASALRAE